MSIFGKIKDAIFGHKQSAAQQTEQMGEAGQSIGAAAGAAVAAAVQAEQPQQAVDVGQVLQDIWQQKGQPNLNYKTSIVDLMKLLDLDSSLSNREELATELGYSGAKDGSAEMNIWLHRAVMDELEKNGGKVPDELKH